GNMTPDEKRAELSKRSALYFADRLPKETPLLLMHGDEDTVVPISQTDSLVKELERLHRPHEYRIIKGGGHVALKDGSYVEIDQYRRKFLKKHLGK
ncbi:MAG: prolyl oligopeptidase family serine peptidase, partial [bacterium]|nr:prolyl oligopeptidase family serine peptidase [bacterium]